MLSTRSVTQLLGNRLSSCFINKTTTAEPIQGGETMIRLCFFSFLNDGWIGLLWEPCAGAGIYGRRSSARDLACGARCCWRESTWRFVMARETEIFLVLGRALTCGPPRVGPAFGSQLTGGGNRTRAMAEDEWKMRAKMGRGRVQHR
jgi:hypothetical protein